MKIPFHVFTAAALLIGVVGCVTTPTSKPTAEISRPAQAILDRWAEAQGGESALRKSASYAVISKVNYGARAPEMEVRTWRAGDGRFRSELVVPNGRTFVQGFDGRIAWYASEQLGFGLMPQAELAQMLGKGDMLEPLKVAQHYISCEVQGSKMFDNMLCHVLELKGRDGIAETWYFDGKTGQRVRIERAPAPGHPQGVTVNLSDFRQVGTVTGPHHVIRMEGGNTVVTEIESMTIDPKLDDTMFQATPEQLSDAKHVEQALARHLEGVGGMEAFMRLKSRVTHATMVNAGIKSRMVISQKLPTKVLVETDVVGMGRIVQGYDGKTGWINSEIQGYRTLKGAELQQLLSNADLRVDTQLGLRFPLRKWIGVRVVDGRKAEAIALASWQGVAGTYYFDAENGLILRVESKLIAGPNSVLPVTVDFSDFHTIDGMTMPFVTTTTNPAMRMVITIESVENNVTLDDAIFKPRKD